MQKYLEGLSEMVSFEGGILFYSMWDGYKEKEDIANFLKFMQEKGVRVVDLHTSGHADEKTIQALLEAIKPDFVIPVHTENAEWFGSHGDFKVIHDKEFKL